MKLALFNTRVIYGGGEKVLNWVALQLINEGIEVLFLAPNIDENYITKLKEVNLYGKVSTSQYPHHLKHKHPIAYCNAISTIYKEHHVDAILIFGGSLLEEIIARSMGLKVILSERCNPHWRKIPSRILKKIQYWFGSGFVFQTKEQAMCYSKYARKNCEIILNPIIEMPTISAFNKRKEIVTVGRLSKEKNVEGIIKAFNKLHIAYPDYKLIIYGNGPQEQNIRNLIKSLNLYDSIEIIQGKTNITDLIQGASLFVLNSTNEGMPNALVEAMSIGLPCISTDCPIYGPRALIEDGVNGFLVPVNDTESLYNKMLKVLEKPELASFIAANALKIRQTLDPAVISKKWINFILKIVQNDKKNVIEK